MKCFIGPAVLLSLLLTSPAAVAQQITHVVPVPAGALVYDPVSQKIYATVGSSDRPEWTNSVVAIDPATGQVGPSVFVGSGPGALAISDGGKYLYVTVSDGSSVRRVSLPALTAGPLYAFPGKPVRSLRPVKGDPEAMIVHRGNHARYDDSLGIYVNGQLKGAESGCAMQLAQGIAPSRLFTYQNMISSWDFDGYDVSEKGIAHISHSGAVMSGNIGLNGSINGLLITSGGALIDPEIRSVIGRLDFKGKSGAFIPDPSTATVLCLSEERNGQALSACSTRNYAFLGSIFLNSGTKGAGGSPVLWGADGFAYAVGGKVVIAHVNRGPGLGPVDLSVTRSPIPGTLPAGNGLKYQLQVRNTGVQPATAVFLSDQLPPEAEVLTVGASQGSATFADGTVRAELGTIPGGGTATVDVSLQFKEVREVRLTAVVRALEPDSNPDNNVARFSPNGPLSPLPDLTGEWGALRQVAIGAGVDLQAGIQGRFTVRNDGKQPARPVKLRFYFSPGPRFDVRICPLLQELTIPGLRPGQKYAANLQALLPQGEDITGLFVFAVLDADGAQEESNSANNVVGQRVP